MKQIPEFTSPYGESMFTAIACLVDNCFDAITLRLFMAQSLANALKIKDTYALRCFHMYRQSSTSDNEFLLQAHTLIQNVGLEYAKSS